MQKYFFNTATRAWRTALTGFLFIAFGLGSLCLSYGFFNLLALICPKSSKRRTVFRSLVRRVFQFFFYVIHKIGLISYRIEGRENLKNLQGTIVIANHPSLIDIVCLLSLCPNATCIVKPALKRNIFLRGVIICANYIIASDFEFLTNQVREVLDNGENLIVFPEGTRTGQDEILTLQRGTAKLAHILNAPVLPVVLTVHPRILSKKSSWHETGEEKAIFHVEIKEPFRLNSIIDPATPPSLVTRVATRYFATILRPDGQEIG